MLKNELLQKALAQVESNLKDRTDFDKIVKSGQRVITDKATFEKLTDELVDSKNPVDDVARGIVSVLNILKSRARGTMPDAAMLQAGQALLLEALDFMEQSGLIKVDAKVLDDATDAYLETVLPTVGLTKERLERMLAQLQASAEDPARMAEFEQAVGGGK